MWPLDSCEKSSQIYDTHLHTPVGNAILAAKCCLTLCYATIQIIHRGKMSAEPEMLPVFPAAPVHAHLSTNTPFSSTPRSFQRQYKALKRQINNHKYTATNLFFPPLLLGSSIGCVMNLRHISLSHFTQNFSKTL